MPSIENSLMPRLICWSDVCQGSVWPFGVHW